MKNKTHKGKTTILPLGDRLLVKPLEKSLERTASGIFMPEGAEKDKREQGEVVAVGEGWYTKDGKLMPLRVKKGDRVIYSKYGFDEITVEGIEYVIVKEENILAIIK